MFRQIVAPAGDRAHDLLRSARHKVLIVELLLHLCQCLFGLLLLLFKARQLRVMIHGLLVENPQRKEGPAAHAWRCSLQTLASESESLESGKAQNRLEVRAE